MSHVDSKNKCVLCGRCLESCPIFMVTGKEELSPRGKAFLIDHFQEHGIPEKNAINLAELCLGCKKCLQVCPQELNLPLEIARLKSVRTDWKALIWAKMIKSGPVLFSAARAMRTVIPRSLPIINNSLFARPDPPLLLKVYRKSLDKGKQAVIFPGCAAKIFYPGLEKQAALLLKALGFEVLPAPDWDCCGYHLGSAGLFEKEKNAARKNIRLWESMGRPLIFVFCATCADGLTDMFSDIDGLDEYRSFSRSVWPLADFLADIEPEPAKPAQNINLIWHQPCHGTGSSGSNLKRVMDGLNMEMVIPGSRCCGMGGSFSVQNPELSTRIAAYFWQDISVPASTMVLTDCNGCLLQLNSTRPGRAFAAHWLEILTFSGQDGI